MTPEEINLALQAAFEQCDRADHALTSQQKQILRRALGVGDPEGRESNPLQQLNWAERQALLEFVHAQQQQNQSWKRVLLNDWLNGRNSGPVQFLRDRYGIQWLEQIKPIHLADYDNFETGSILPLKVGDRIEVTNGLWEWVQESGPCSREWFPCTVIGFNELPSSAEATRTHTSCLVRFDSGAEYEIQGIYEWNRPNWRWIAD